MEMIGIGQNWRRDILLGLLFGTIFIVANIFTGISIGLPSLPAQVVGKYGIVSVLAPIFEEAGFRGVLLFLTGGFGLIPLYLINIITFSLFHYVAYGASLAAMSASFIGAGLFAAFAVFVTLRYKSILPAIITHAIFNTFLLTKYFVLVAI